ncbi:MAG TPA: hypothetical protein VM285_06610, partial [Polyangia bacterium]|nr:hypothetical protein [Polyangia bacterium]
DTDTDTDADTDSDTDTDTDTDSDSDTSGACQVELVAQAGMFLEGVCQTPEDECGGGTLESNPQADCDEGQVCCISDDQCDAIGQAAMGILGCEESECLGEAGFQLGCPAGGWCCAPVESLAGEVPLDGTCGISFANMISLTGICAELEDDCPGGTISGLEQANCVEDLQCCIAPTECEAQGMGFLSCSATECDGLVGIHAGCADGGWCCSPL